jgi:L-fucose mutarotase/ribose pyranase (RbsD/FucU family)
MSDRVKTLLQQINFIEIDMDMQKQILVSIPSDAKADIEATILKIAEMKKQVEELRNRIKEADEDEYNKMVAIERAADEFKRIAKTKKFTVVNTLNESGECYITLTDGTRLDCLVAAREENGNWTILTLDGETKEYPAGIIR